MIFLPRVVLLFTAIQKRYNRLPLFLFRKSNIKGGDSVFIQEDALPNITGHWNGNWNYSMGVPALVVQGCFVEGNSLPSRIAGDDSRGGRQVAFDASASNPVYGRSDKVLPCSFVLIPQIKY